MRGSPIQPTFSGGEFSPRVQGRVDNERYRTGLAKSLNFLPTTQGPLLRRGGTKYTGADVKDPANPPTLIPFQFSQTQNYILEFGQSYIRFHTNGGQVLSNTTVFKTSGSVFFAGANPGGTLTFNTLNDNSNSRPGLVVTASSIIAASSVLELPSPYGPSDVKNIRYAQKDDTLYLTCDGYFPYKLQRLGSAAWHIQPVLFQDGPYLPLNSYASPGDSVNVSLIPSQPLAPTITTSPSYTIDGTANNGQGEIKLTLHTSSAVFVNGDRVAVRSVLGTLEANNGTSHIGAEYWVVKNATASSIDLAGSAYSFTLTNSTGVVSPALFMLDKTTPFAAWSDAGTNHYRPFSMVSGGTRYWGIIYNVLNAATAQGYFYQQMPATSVIQNWYLGPWTSNNGYPTSLCFHQDRLALAGPSGFPQQIDLSESGLYEAFAPSSTSLVVADDNAMSFNLSSDQRNQIRWTKSDSHGLLTGTAASEWSIAPSSQNAALTPTNFSAKETSYFGSHQVDASRAGNANVYVQNGQRNVRELNYFFQFDTYRSTDLAELADHLMLPGISRLQNQKTPVPLIWASTTDGKLRSMTYSRDDVTLKVGWSQHQLGGQSDSAGTAPVVKSHAVITSSSGLFDQLWCATQRYINGTSVCNIEFMTNPFDDLTDPEQATCLDLSGTYDSPVGIIGLTQAGSAIVTTAPNHGLVDGDVVKINSVVGLNSSFTNAKGVIFNSNLVNGLMFRAGSTTVNSFFLQDINNGSSYIDSRTYTPYFSGGVVRKMVSTVSGFTWLKNETVSVLADGKWHPNVQVNSAGVLALSYKAAIVTAGYSYNSDGKTLRPEIGNAETSSIGDLRRTHRIALDLHRTGEISIGPHFNNLTPLPLPSKDPEIADAALPLFSGIVRESIESEHDFDGQVCFRMSSPFPGMVKTIITKIEVDNG